MQAGRLDKYAVLQRFTTARAASGAATKTWATQTSTWVSIDQLSGRELVDAHQMSAQATHRIVSRYDSQNVPNVKDRWTWDSRTFEIDNVNVDKRARSVTMITTERP